MDNIIHPAEMERCRIQMCSETDPDPGKEAVSLGYSTYSQGNVAQRSKTAVMDWEGKEDVSEDPNMDTGENYSIVDIAKAKNNDVLSLKRLGPNPVVETAVKFTDALKDNDINKKFAKKVVVVPEDTKEEEAPPLEHLFGFQHKKCSQKRTITQAVEEENAPYTFDHVKLKDTAAFIDKLKAGTAESNVCFSYDPRRFSHISNLEPVENAQVNCGTFGVVLEVRDKQTGHILIKKMVKKNAKGQLELEKNEIEVPLQFHDAVNITKFLGLAWNGSELTYVMEDAGISLRKLIASKDRQMLYETNTIEKILLGMLSGIAGLAKHGITHCDIKPENVCVNVKTLVTKLVDFGSSRTLQNEINFKGITPEYLDPSVNRYLHAMLTPGKKIPAQPLDEKDDVYAAGLVCLFLLKWVHPMIHFFTGSSEYPGNPQEQLAKRIEVMKQISEMNEKMLSSLLEEDLKIEMSEVLKKLLPFVLSLDRQQRWTAKMAVQFLKEKMNADQQPPHKLLRQAPNLQLKDRTFFVDLRKKSAVVACGKDNFIVPDQPTVYQFQDNGMGINMKGQAPFTQGGQILLPAKMKFPSQLGQMEMVASTTQIRGNTSPQQQHGYVETPRQKVQPSYQQVQEQENKEYADLVKSFGEQLSPQTPRRLMPAQMNQLGITRYQFQQPRLQLFSPNSTHRTGHPVAETGTPGLSMQEGQADHDIRGLTGGVVKYAGQDGPPVTGFGNVPDIDALMQTSEDRNRPKIKGVRRSRASQD